MVVNFIQPDLPEDSTVKGSEKLEVDAPDKKNGVVQGACEKFSPLKLG